MKTNAKPDMHRIDQVGRAISRQLNEHAADLPHDITERLRVARMQALAQRKPEPVRIFVRLDYGILASIMLGCN